MDKDIIYFGFNNIQARVIVAFRKLISGNI